VSSRHVPLSPPLWDDQTLEQRRTQSIADFITERSAEGSVRYRQAFAKNLDSVKQLFTLTGDLLELTTGAALASQPALTRVARYLGGPPVSADDLDTLADAKIATRRRLEPELAKKAATVIDTALDAERFPWLFESPRRSPSPGERETATRWTAGLQTAQEIQTARRGESARRQEEAVRQLLVSHGFISVAARRIDAVDEIARGEFCREAIVAEAKCDIPVRLRDGRLLLIECKVSNSATNSVKRLNRECGSKSASWRTTFGLQAIPAAVLAGVFKLRNLQDAQSRQHITVFWESDLAALGGFLDAAL
jgi:hypothetical protein